MGKTERSALNRSRLAETMLIDMVADPSAGPQLNAVPYSRSNPDENSAVNVQEVPDLDARFYEFLRDITRRTEIEKWLHIEHNAIQNCSCGIAVVDADGKLDFANPSAIKMWDYTCLADLVGEHFRDMFNPAEHGDEIAAAVLVDGKEWKGECSALSRSGRMFPVEVLASCSRDADGEITGMVLSLADATERRIAEKVRRENEQLKVMQESLAAACHHLGQPLTALSANLWLIRRTPDQDPDTRSKVDGCIEAVDSLKQALDKLRSTSEYRTCLYVGMEGEHTRILDV